MPDATALNGSGLPVTIVNACLREGRGGSPTAVLDETDLSNDERRAVPVLMGTSHAVFLSVEDSGHDGPDVSLRFFTATGELPACGHGTVAALAFLAERAGGGECQATLRTSGGVFLGRVTRVNGQFKVAFEPGSVDVCEPAGSEHASLFHALGITSDMLAPGVCVASLGRQRLLVPVHTRSALAALSPDFDRLRDACDRLGLLGCYVYSVPTAEGRVTARMFAPSIGVPEDIANANSTACLAFRLAREGMTDITVDMGDALGAPSTITAAAWQTEAGPRVHVGGAATIARIVRL
ncbi:PhzF family phenazine biosynthesis protein [Streptomyces sp. NPDC002577]